MNGTRTGLLCLGMLFAVFVQDRAHAAEPSIPLENATWIGAAGGQAPAIRVPGVHGGAPLSDAQNAALPIFRKAFLLEDAPVSHAHVLICGLGQFELSINGRKVGDHFLDPPWSDYADTCYTVRFDVTEFFKPGENVLGVMLGNGMYNVSGGRYAKFVGSFGAPKLILCLQISQGDKTQTLTSDSTWKTDAGPITFSCIYGGEDYDARREQPGWDAPGFDDSHWNPVKVVAGPGGTLRPATSPPVKVVRHLEGPSVTRLEDGRYEIDLGENLSARPVIKVKGKAGARVTIEAAERRGKPWQGHSYTYTLKGDAKSEAFAPRFTYFGFQYLYVSGVAWGDDIGDTQPLPELVDIGADFVSSCGSRIGRFACSNTLFNDIDAMIDRSVASNLQHVLTDCPHREKLGWLEVAHLMGPSILFNYDMGDLYRKICRDTTDSQLDNGSVPDIAPEYVRFQGGFFESPEWGSAAVQLPWLISRWYGDVSILREQYATMARYTDYLAGTRSDAGLVRGGLGDWYDWTPQKGHVGPSQLTPPELPATCMLYDNARILHQVAKMQGRVADTQKWKGLMQDVRRDFLAAYYDTQHKTVATGSQCALAMGLYFGLAPEQDRHAVLANLVRNVETSQYRPSTGEVSFRFLVLALAEAGRSDVVYRMINRTDAPGYGCMLKQGLKTLSERWDRPGSSLNHCMFGHIQEWFQAYLLGIRQAPGSTGYDKVLIDPFFPEDLDWAAGSFDAPSGPISVAWARKDGIVEVTIEAETTEVTVPRARKQVRWKIKDRSGRREEFTLQDRHAFLILPEKSDLDEPTPWIWYAPTLKGLPGKAEAWMFDRFLANGMAIAGVDVGESYGSPEGRAIYSALYNTLVEERGLSKKPCLLARSRGGLMLYSWAAEHPESVACIAGIYPVCNLSSYPGLARACGAYGMTEDQLATKLTEHNPIDRLVSLAEAKVPIFHIHGDNDTVVPLDENSAVVKARYDTLGGPMALEVVKGQGHNMWSGWFHSQDLVDFVIANARERSAGQLGSVSVTDLRCEYLSNPLGVDVPLPRFSWKLVDSKKTRAQKQTAFQIVVEADAPDGTGPRMALWDSGRVDSSASVNNVYAGKALKSNQNCFWKVRVWDKDGQVTAWSPEARFSMGLLDPSDWQGDWIRYREADNIKHIWYRKTFSLHSVPALAFVHLGSIGYHELYVNGQRIGTRVLSPGVTNLERRALYVTYDITPQLAPGDNVVAVWTGPGWARADGSYGKGVWKQDSIFKCQINMSNGPSLSSDATWKCRVSSSENLGLWKGGGRGEYGGERIDARTHVTDWNRASCDDGDWAHATVYAKSLLLSAEMMEPDRRVETLRPVSMTEKQGLYTFDMGRNFTGWLEMKLRHGEAGQTVKFMTANQAGRQVEFKQESHYIHDASGAGTFSHRFNYMAGRWVTVQGLSYRPDMEDVTCYIVTNDRTRTGHFTCSNPLLNRIYETDLRTYIANTVNGVLMDCPHRERYGYGEVSFACMWGCGIPNYDSAAFYTKATRDWFDVQREDGFVNTIAPQVYRGAGGTLWSSAPVTMTWEFYRAYGDKRQLAQGYGPMKKWLDYLHGYVSDDGVLTPYTGASRFLGDWATPHGSEYGNIPAAKLFNNCVYAYNLDVFVQAARILGKPDVAKIYAARLADLRKHAHTHFFNEQSKTYIHGRQLSMAFPLYTGITPEHERAAVFANLVKEITQNKPYLDTGSPGLPILLKYIIEDVERPDLLVPCLTRTEQPGYGYFLNEGETTWPEYWQNVGHDSKIHTCYTSIAGYFTRGIGGIQPDPEDYGMKQFIIKPHLVGDLTFANTTSGSNYGSIKSHWSRSGSTGEFHIDIPVNTTARVTLPARDVHDVLEAGRPIAGIEGVTVLEQNDSSVVLRVASGVYDFSSASVPVAN